MSKFLKNYVLGHPTVTLSHTDYGEHFVLGCGINIPSSPTQRIRSFVENGHAGAPYRFMVVGRLTSFKVVEDPFGHFLSVNLSELHPCSMFTEMFYRQLETLQKIEEEEALDNSVHDQQAQWRTTKGHLVFRVYDASNHPLSSADIGSFVLAIVELRCLEVGQSSTAFSRTYWIEAVKVRCLSSCDHTDDEDVENVIETL